MSTHDRQGAGAGVETLDRWPVGTVGVVSALRAPGEAPEWARLLDEIGVDNVMWSSDYPHNESTFGYSQRSIKSVVDAVGQEAAVKMCSTNIKKFLGV